MKKSSKSIKIFLEKNKKKIVIIGVTCTALAIGWFLKGKIDSKIIQELNEEILLKDSKINTLGKACKEKDAFMKRFFSNGTRDGYSECARQLSYMRWTA